MKVQVCVLDLEAEQHPGESRSEESPQNQSTVEQKKKEASSWAAATGEESGEHVGPLTFSIHHQCNR